VTTGAPADGLSTIESDPSAVSVVDARGVGRRLRSAVLAFAACAFTFVIGAALGISGDPAHLALGAVIGLVTFAGAVAAPRFALVLVTFLLVAYVADAAPGVAGRVAVTGAIGALLAATLLRARIDRTSISIPGDAGWIFLYVAAFAIVTVTAEDRSAAMKPFFDLVGYGALAILLVALMDNEQWVRRFAWAVASALGLLAILAVYQQLSRSFDTAFGGIARVEFDGGLTRSGGPISANYFGQVLAAGCVLAVYLALAARSRRERAVALVIVGVSAVALVYTFSRGAMVALVAAALLAAILRHVRPVLIVLVAVGTVFAAMFLLPPEVSQRVRELGQLAAPSAGTDPSLRGRTSENLAAIEMWRAHPIEGVGPANFERRYLDYSARIGIDDRAEPRSAHSLYLEALAETGLIGAIPLFGLIFIALRRAWQARRDGIGDARLLAEGSFVALVAFLVSAVTLHNAFPRFLWVFLALALAAGRLRQPATP
jgi:putative inorganic carbon (hco3(-)) transporter